MSTSLVVILSTAIAQADAAAPPKSMVIGSVWDFIVKGGPVMIPIGACSLIALALIVERSFSLRRGHVIPRGFLDGLRSAMGKPPGNIRHALEYARVNPSPIARVLTAAIKRFHDSEESLSRHVQEAGEREAIKLRKYLRVLWVIASIAPLLGLLGTIFGMIRAFQTVAASAEALGKTEMLATGIYEAMITTAAGLIVAIPALIGYHWLSARIDALVMEIDRAAVDFIEEHGPRRGLVADLERPASPHVVDGQPKPAVLATIPAAT